MTGYGEEILRVAQDDKQYVILNEVKNPLRANKRLRTQRIASEEILRVAQDDRVCERDYRVGHAILAMTESSSLAMKEQQKRVPTRGSALTPIKSNDYNLLISVSSHEIRAERAARIDAIASSYANFSSWLGKPYLYP